MPGTTNPVGEGGEGTGTTGPATPTDALLIYEGAEAGGGQGTLYWRHGDSASVSGFNIYHDGALIGNTPDQPYELRGLVGAGVWTVKAVASNGTTESAASAPALINPPVPPGFRIHLHDKKGKQRRRFPAAQLVSFDCSENDETGYAECTVVLSGGPGEFDKVLTDDRLDVWYFQTRIYRGFHADNSFASGSGGGQWTFKFYSGWKELAKPPVNRQVRIAGGSDISTFFALFGGEAKKRSDLPDVTVTARNTGVVIDTAECKQQPVGDALKQLKERAGKRVVSGLRVNGNGENELFIEPMTAPDAPADFVIVVNGDRTGAPEFDRESSNVCNDLTLIAGPPKYGNLLPDPIFANTRFAGDEIGNLLLSPSFEDRSNWELGGGASYKVTGLSEGAAHDGDDMVELDHGGEYIRQHRENIGEQIVPGHTYKIGAWVKRRNGDVPVTLDVFLRWLSGSAEVGVTNFTIAPPSGDWDKYEAVSVPPAGANGVEVFVNCEAVGGGALLDSLFLYDTSVVLLENWVYDAHGDAHVVAVNLQDDTNPFFGSTAIYIDVQAHDDDARDVIILVRGSQKFRVSGGSDTIRVDAWVYSFAGEARPKVRIQINDFDKNTIKKSDTHQDFASVAGTGQYDRLSHTHTCHDEAETAEVLFRIRGNGRIRLGGISARNASSDPDEFIPGAQIIIRKTAKEIFAVAAGNPAHPDFPYWNSETVYGRKPDQDTQENITTRADALAYIAVFLRARSLEIRRPNWERFHDATPYAVGKTLRAMGRNRQFYMPTPQPIVEIRSSLERGGVFVRRLSCDTRRPGEAELLEAFVRKVSGQAGGGGSAAYQALSGGGSGGSGGGNLVSPPPSTVAEVVFARTRDAVSGLTAFTWDTLKGNLQGLWEALGKRTADPNGQSAGRVLMTNGADGVAWGDANGGGGDITLVAGTGIDIDEFPAGTYTIAATGGGSGGSGSPGSGATDLQVWGNNVSLYDGYGLGELEVILTQPVSTYTVHFERGAGLSDYGVIWVINRTSSSISLVKGEASTQENSSGGSLFTLIANAVCRLVRVPSGGNSGLFTVFVDTGSISQHF